MNNNNNIYEPISQNVTRCFILGRKLVFPFRLPRIGLTFGTSVGYQELRFMEFPCCLRTKAKRSFTFKFS